MPRYLIEQGLQHHRDGRIDAAKAFYEQALEKNPRDPDGLHLLGLTCLQSGDPARAVDLIRRAIGLHGKNPAFHANLGAALIECGNPREALAAFRKAGKLNADEPQFQMAIANCHALCGEPALAEDGLRKLTQRFPAYGLAWFNLGNVIRDQHRPEEAVDIYRRAIACDAALLEAHNNLGATLLSLGYTDEAATAYRRAIALNPRDAVIRCNLASALIDGGNFAAAETECRAAVACAPDMALARSFLASAIGHQGRLLEALDHHRKACELDPANSRLVTALGNALCDAGFSNEGYPLLERAVAMAPAAWEGHYSLAMVRLSSGDFDAGWQEFLQRPTRLRFMQLHPEIELATALPTDLAGKHLCIHSEQGLGDQIFFLRFVAAAKARGARITYQSAPKIAEILGRVAIIDDVIGNDAPLPTSDFNLLVSDLPVALLAQNPDASDPAVNQHLPPPLVLTPRPENLKVLRERLSRLGPPPYIGVTWRGGTAPAAQKSDTWLLFKEAPLDEFGAALRNNSATLLALQRNPEPGEIDRVAAAAGKPLYDLTALNEDLEAMLALLALIDDYVGVSNTNMHLRASIGRTARVVVPCPAEWRWMAQGNTSPWFPGFSIYRQELNGDWDAALTRLSSDLRTAFPPR